MQITWPSELIEVPDSVTCTVVTNRAYEKVCNISQSEYTITISNVFSESVAYLSEVTITLVGVINPVTNKEKGRGFTIQTYTDINLNYRIDYLPSQYLVPTLDCDYPCRTCLATERDWCESCWTQDWSEKKYFYRDESTS